MESDELVEKMLFVIKERKRLISDDLWSYRILLISCFEEICGIIMSIYHSIPFLICCSDWFFIPHPSFAEFSYMEIWRSNGTDMLYLYLIPTYFLFSTYLIPLFAYLVPSALILYSDTYCLYPIPTSFFFFFFYVVHLKLTF